jgi:hypothetical protein
VLRRRFAGDVNCPFALRFSGVALAAVTALAAAVRRRGGVRGAAFSVMRDDGAAGKGICDAAAVMPAPCFVGCVAWRKKSSLGDARFRGGVRCVAAAAVTTVAGAVVPVASASSFAEREIRGAFGLTFGKGS